MRRPAAAAALVLVLVMTGACTVSFDGPAEVTAGAPTVAPLVRDGRAEIDLRTLPTRDDLGLPPGINSKVTDRERGSDGIRVHLIPPSGQPVDLLAFGVVVGTRRMTPSPADGPQQPPTNLTINVRVEGAQDAARLLREQTGPLGLDPAGVERIVQRTRPGTISSGVVDGLLLKNYRLAVEVRTDEDAGEVVLNYLIDFADLSMADPAEIARGGPPLLPRP